MITKLQITGKLHYHRKCDFQLSKRKLGYRTLLPLTAPIDRAHACCAANETHVYVGSCVESLWRWMIQFVSHIWVGQYLAQLTAGWHWPTFEMKWINKINRRKKTTAMAAPESVSRSACNTYVRSSCQIRSFGLELYVVSRICSFYFVAIIIISFHITSMSKQAAQLSRKGCASVCR